MSRWRYFLQRLALAVPILIFGMTIVFVLVRLGPIDPARAIAGPQSPQSVPQIRARLGLDQPLWQQYIDFMWNFLTLDLGQSWVVYPATDVYELIGTFAPRTIWLGFWSVLIAIFVGIPLGFYAGLNPNTGGDYVASFGGIVWRAMPNFWLAIILISVLSQSQDLLGFSWENWLINTNIITPPPLGFLTDPSMFLTDTDEAIRQFVAALKQVAPAALVLGSASMGNEMRIGRTAVLETINSNYVETARAKGVPGRSIVWKHVFRNASIPLVPIITGEATLLIGGSVIVETIFAVNGIGSLFFEAALNADLPLLSSLMFVFILLSISVNVLQDFLYTVIDPRVGYERN